MNRKEGQLYAVIITPDDDISIVAYPKRTGDPLDELRWMKAQVDGKITVIDQMLTGCDTAMVISEDGKILGFPHNDVAQKLIMNQTEYIVGNALILYSIGDDLVGFTLEEAEKVRTIAKAEQGKLGKLF